MSKFINKVIQKAIDLTGGTQVALANKAGISQNAVWKLLTGATKQPSYKTSVLLERAVNKEISRVDFMESKAEAKAIPESSQLEIKVNNKTESVTL